MPDAALVSDLLAAKEGFDPDLFGALDSDDLADIQSRASDPNSPQLLRAIELLARLDPTNAALAVGQLLAFGADPAQQAAAIDVLVASGSVVIPVAIAAALSADDFIALAAWGALQRTATDPDLAVIGPLVAQASGIAAEQASFAQSVIAYRAGLAGFERQVLEADALLSIDPAEETTGIDTAAADPADFARLGLLSGGGGYGLSFDATVATAIDCAGTHMLLALDTGVAAAFPDRLVEAPALAGVVFVLDPFDLGYSPLQLVLTWPDGFGGFNVALCDPDGTTAYFGTGTLADGQATATLRAAFRPGAVAVDLAVIVSSGGVTFTQAVSGAAVSAATPKLAIDADPDGIDPEP